MNTTEKSETVGDIRPSNAVPKAAPRPRFAIILILALFFTAGCIAGLTSPASAQTEDDLFLFTSSVAPNVLIQLDNSGSMNHIVWHPDFDPDGSYDCNYYGSGTYYLSQTKTLTRCGRTRKMRLCKITRR